MEKSTVKTLTRKRAENKKRSLPTTNSTIPPTDDLPTRLRKATDTLRNFSLETKKLQKQSGLKKTVGMIKGLLDRALGRHKSNHHEEVLEAVEVINSQRFAIGSLDNETHLSITKAVDAYNVCRELSDDEALSLPKIAIPNRVRPVERHFGAQRQYKVTTSTIKMPKAQEQLPKQTSELFHMKVISLLERYGISTNPEARQTVKSSPISLSLNVDEHLCTLTQTFQLFPWQTITVQGSSKVDPITQAIRHFLPDSFSLSLVTLQTAFPHPMQRAGWSLAEHLLPETPQRPDRIPELSALYDRKQEAQELLLTDAKTLETTKALFKNRCRAFKEHATELLELHQELAQSMIAAAATEDEPLAHVATACEEFFTVARAEKDPYDFISSTNEILRDLWITKPWHAIVEEIAKSHLTGEDDEEILSETQKLLDTAYDAARTEIAEKVVKSPEARWKWIEVFGNILGTASRNILLQNLSEDLEFLPLALSTFETQLQTSAYNHLSDFLNEVSNPDEIARDPSQTYLLMKLQIISDIALFRTNTRSRISIDLENYALERYDERVMEIL
jgi:hypothetical protein